MVQMLKYFSSIVTALVQMLLLDYFLSVKEKKFRSHIFLKNTSINSKYTIQL